LPRLSSWPAFHRYHHARGGRKPPEACYREDSNIIHNALRPSQSNTSQPGIHPRTSCLSPPGTPGNSSFLSMNSHRSRRRILLSGFYPFRNPLFQLLSAVPESLARTPHFQLQPLISFVLRRLNMIITPASFSSSLSSVSCKVIARDPQRLLYMLGLRIKYRPPSVKISLFSLFSPPFPLIGAGSVHIGLGQQGCGSRVEKPQCGTNSKMSDSHTSSCKWNG
jgi:hypothetical protein